MKNIRSALAKDLDPLTELFELYRSFYGKMAAQDEARDFLKHRLENKDSEILVAEENGKLVGFTQLYPLFSSTRMKKYWLLNDLFVHENYRGKNWAKKLISEAKIVCKTSGACGILLETDKTNLIGNQLYPGCGFKMYDHANFYEWTNKEA